VIRRSRIAESRTARRGLPDCAATWRTGCGRVRLAHRLGLGLTPFVDCETGATVATSCAISSRSSRGSADDDWIGTDDEWSPTPLAVGRFPPEPARYVGGLAVRAAVARKERAEDAGRRADPLTARLASLAPAGLVPVKQRNR
jgi:hypothetical protein